MDLVTVYGTVLAMILVSGCVADYWTSVKTLTWNKVEIDEQA